MSEIRLSVIIPAYNEEKRLPKTLREVDAYLKKQNYSYEILVINDGSRDGTAAAVERLQGEIKNLRLVDNKSNHGKGYVVRQGMLEAKGEYRVFMDADNATAIDHVERMWPEFDKGSQVIIGSRDMKGAVRTVRQVWWRERLGDIFNLIVQVMSGLWGIWDTQCGFKGFTRKAAEDIFSKATINRWAFDPEILVIAKRAGYTIKEIPVTWVNDPHSQVRFGGMVNMIIEVVQIRLNLFKGKYG